MLSVAVAGGALTVDTTWVDCSTGAGMADRAGAAGGAVWNGVFPPMRRKSTLRSAAESAGATADGVARIEMEGLCESCCK